MATKFEGGAVVLMVFTMLLAPVAGVAATADSGAVENSTAPQTVTVSSNVSVWQGAPLPLRANSSEKSVNIGAVSINIESLGTGDVPLNKRHVGVYTKGETVNLTFKDRTGVNTSQFAGAKTQLVVAHVTNNSATVNLTNQSATSSQEVSFDVKNVGNVSESGRLTTQYDGLNESGNYLFFLATVDEGNGFTAQNGSLSVDGNVTVIGIDRIIVETAASDVTAPQHVTRGENATFEVSTPATTPVNHTIVLYNKSTLADSETKVTVSQLDLNTTTEAITVNHSIESISGVARFDGPVPVMGQRFDQNRNGTWESQPVIKMVAEGAIPGSLATDALNFSNATFHATDTTTLNASITGVSNVSGSQTINVSTLPSWSPGEYVWVHVASNQTDRYTDIGTLQVKNDSVTDPEEPTSPPTTPEPTDPGGPTTPGGPTDPGSPSGPSGPSGPTGPTQPTQPPTQPPANNQGAANVTKTGDRVTINITNVQKNQQVVVDIPNESDDLNTSGVGLERISMTFTQNTSFDMNYHPSNGSNVPPVSQSGNTVGYFQVDHPQSDEAVGNVSFTFSVSKQKLEQRNLTANRVQLYRYHDSQWNGLETSVVSEGANSYRFEAVSPGLSTFAIAEAQANISVTDASLSTHTITAGESVTITATVENTGGAEGEETISLNADGEVVTSKTVTVAAESTKTVEFTREFAEAGSFGIAVNDVSAGTLTVEQDGGGNVITTQAPPTGGSGLGIGGMVLIAAILSLIIGGAYYSYSGGYLNKYLK